MKFKRENSANKRACPPPPPPHPPALARARLPSSIRCPPPWCTFCKFFSRLHLVDGELCRYKGREKNLLRKYKAEFAPAPAMGGGEYEFGRTAGMGERGGGRDTGTHFTGGGAPLLKGVLENAREEEARRVQASLEASLQRIRRKAGRR